MSSTKADRRRPKPPRGSSSSVKRPRPTARLKPKPLPRLKTTPSPGSGLTLVGVAILVAIMFACWRAEVRHGEVMAAAGLQLAALKETHAAVEEMARRDDVRGARREGLSIRLRQLECSIERMR